MIDIASKVNRRIAGRPLLQRGDVQWEGLRFSFYAEPWVARKAAARGIENGLCRLAMAAAPPGGVAVDAGANYGFVTTIMAYAVGEKGQVHSFEPLPFLNEALSKTLESNGIKHVTLHRKAVGDAAGSLDIGPGKGSVPIVTLDETLVSTDRLDFLKVDVDGPDLEVLMGARGLISRFHPVICVEVENKVNEFRDLLDSLGYRHFVDTENNAIQWGERAVNVVASVDPIRVPLRGELAGIR